jgi:hypothetical protein
MNRKQSRLWMTFLTSMCLFALVFGGALLYSYEEGGYAGNDPRADNVVWSFLQHFMWEQFHWGQQSFFTTNNNQYVDAMDFAFYCGHGSPYHINVYRNPLIGDYASVSINLETAGAGAVQRGYGTVDLEFIVFYSCSVIPSALDVGNWWGPWISEADDIFDRLHQALGFRTPAFVTPSYSIADDYGMRIARGDSVLWSWISSIQRFGWQHRGGDFASVILHPSAVNDTYVAWVADPPENHGDLMNVFMW